MAPLTLELLGMWSTPSLPPPSGSLWPSVVASDRILYLKRTKQCTYAQLNAQSTGTVEYTDCLSTEGNTPHNECPRYGSKLSNGEVPVMLDLWGMRSTPSLLSLPGQLLPWVVALDRALFMGQKELNSVLVLN